METDLAQRIAVDLHQVRVWYLRTELETPLLLLQARHQGLLENQALSISCPLDYRCLQICRSATDVKPCNANI